MCNPGKLKRLIDERERIIKEHDTGSVFIENGKVVQGAGQGGGKKAVASEAQQKVSKTSYPKIHLPHWLRINVTTLLYVPQ